MADKPKVEPLVQSEVKVTSSFVWAVICVIVIPTALIVLIAYIVNSTYLHGKAPESAKAIEERIKPIGEVTVRDPNAPVVLKTGEEVFKGLCISCHGSGLMGAPKAGDKAAWSKVIGQGQNTVFDHAIKGIRAMPAKGGNPDLDEVEVQRAVVYMANLAGAGWKEPAAPAAKPAVAKETEKTETSAETAAPAVSTATAQDSAAAVNSTPEPSQAASTSTEAKKIDGKSVYDSTCMACHGTGIAGAPAGGNKAAWAPRIKQGKPVLYQHALQGFNAMPAKGGNTSLSDDEVKAAVDYLVSQAQ